MIEPRGVERDLPITILVDGACGVCRREACFLLRLDRGRGRIIVKNLVDPATDPASFGCSLERAMREIHGVLPDGRVVTGMEVFRRAYAAVGLGWLLAPTAWPGLRAIFDRLYSLFARNRTPLLGGGGGRSVPGFRAVSMKCRAPVTRRAHVGPDPAKVLK